MAKKMTLEERRLLCAWIDQLRTDFELDAMDVPLEDLLALAGVVSTGVARPAVPVTAYVAGYLTALRTRKTPDHGAAHTIQDVIAVVPAPAANPQDT
ncbi:hypothetical protein AS188_03220 [Kocuria flava]|uniref:DUF6457 domain-containing protein n=1 Tax=Kocuria flava TaxID=446860 RepID=A0A0U3HVI0_9MICC|nr:DUF6457 domain-containing protein [Kocuria flava]ALU38919.1 hypothetical protein AS188_03220 [Kocuria flava]GEO93358.1 hypothetical protein KFL01_26640 [Kocuria flava]